MDKDLLQIPMGASEPISNHSFMVARNLLNYEPKKGEQINVLFSSGFIYNGEIYHKAKSHIYVYLY